MAVCEIFNAYRMLSTFSRKQAVESNIITGIDAYRFTVENIIPLELEW